MDGETELEQEQFRNGSARKNISAAICADEISFRERGTEMEKRNWNKNSFEMEVPERIFQLRSVQMKFLSGKGALKWRNGTGIKKRNWNKKER